MNKIVNLSAVIVNLGGPEVLKPADRPPRRPPVKS